MCNSYCIIRSLNTNKFVKFSNILNIVQLILNFLIIITSILCFTYCDSDLIINTGYSSYVNNIFFCFIMMLITILLIYYNKKNYLIKDKKRTSITLICFCLGATILKCFTSLALVVKIKKLYRLYRFKSDYNYKNNNRIYKQVNLLLIYALYLLGFFILLGIFWLIYILLIYNLNIIILNNDANNVFYNRNSYLSTKPDFDDNGQEIAVENLNDGNKDNNFIYVSKNIINKIEKEYEDKGTQTNIKGIC